MSDKSNLKSDLSVSGGRWNLEFGLLALLRIEKYKKTVNVLPALLMLTRALQNVPLG